MQLDFEIETQFENAFGHFLTGQFVDQTPSLVAQPTLKMGEFLFQVWGQPRNNIWTLKLLEKKHFNFVGELQRVQFFVL